MALEQKDVLASISGLFELLRQGLNRFLVVIGKFWKSGQMFFLLWNSPLLKAHENVFVDCDALPDESFFQVEGLRHFEVNFGWLLTCFWVLLVESCFETSASGLFSMSSTDVIVNVIQNRATCPFSTWCWGPTPWNLRKSYSVVDTKIFSLRFEKYSANAKTTRARSSFIIANCQHAEPECKLLKHLPGPNQEWFLQASEGCKWILVAWLT